jgi:hypothetical protein
MKAHTPTAAAANVNGMGKQQPDTVTREPPRVRVE